MTRLLNRPNSILTHLKSLVVESFFYTYDQVSDDNSRQEERNARDIADVHTIPHRLNPLAAQHSEYDHERVHEVCEVPPR